MAQNCGSFRNICGELSAAGGVTTFSREIARQLRARREDRVDRGKVQSMYIASLEVT
jgi:hypothetical protein